MADISIHWVKDIKARRHDYEDAALQIDLRTDWSEMPTQIALYCHNDALVKALVKAINETVAAHKPADAPAEGSEIAA